jgi:hypothetical protein
MLQGNCTKSFEGSLPASFQFEEPNLLPLKQNQCLLVADSDVLDIRVSSLWLDNIYFRIRNSTALNPPVIVRAQSDARLWATNVTFQGDGHSSTQALQATDARGVYASGVLQE